MSVLLNYLMTLYNFQNCKILIIIKCAINLQLLLTEKRIFFFKLIDHDTIFKVYEEVNIIETLDYYL